MLLVEWLLPLQEVSTQLYVEVRHVTYLKYGEVEVRSTCLAFLAGFLFFGLYSKDFMGSFPGYLESKSQ